jgi:hypothetical protein
MFCLYYGFLLQYDRGFLFHIYTENIEKNIKMQFLYKSTIKFVRVHFFVYYEND